jgi:CheY-like chemotaxis protein
MASHSNLPPVLVVDDSADDLILIKRLLAKAGIKNPVVTFDDPTKVLAFLKAAAQTPDSGLIPCIVFTDLKMPRVDGFDLLKWVRDQKKPLADLPVIILSGGAEEKDLKRAKTLRANKYIVKFPKPEAIAAIIAEACAS